MIQLPMTTAHPTPPDWFPSETTVHHSPPPIRGWDGGRAILFYLLAASVSILLGVLLFPILGFHLSVALSETLAFGFLPAAVCVVFATRWRQWMGPSCMNRRTWVWSVVAVAAFAVAQSNLPVVFDRIYPIPSGQLLVFQQYLTAQTPFELFLLFLIAALVPAVFEEFTFRGVIQAGIRDTYGPRHAVVWTGFLFALLHLNPWNFVGLWSFGCLLGYLVERTGSIRPAMVLHLLNNTLALVVFSVQGRAQWEQRPEFIPWYWTLIAGVALIIAIQRLHKLTAPNEGSADPGSGTPGSLNDHTDAEVSLR